jgi:hypothetical protein
VLPSAPVPNLPRSWRRLLGAAVSPTVAPFILLGREISSLFKSKHSNKMGSPVIPRNLRILRAIGNENAEMCHASNRRN